MIEQDLARIAGALEQIAQVMAEAPVDKVLSPPERKWLKLKEAGIDKPLPTDIDSQATQAGNSDDADHLKRENLKHDLRALGVPFKDSARTGTLQKLLDDKLASMLHPEAMGATEGETPAETEEPKETPKETKEPVGAETATRDDVRMALIGLSAAKGKDAALAMLRKVGGAEKLSDVAEDRYAELTKACKEQSNG